MAPLEKKITQKFSQINENIKNSFILIRQDITEMQKKVEAMRTYLKSQKNQIDLAREQEIKIRKQLKSDVDEFTQKTSQLSLALSRVKELQDNLVTKKHLAQIEDTIRTGFKDDLKETNEQIPEFKKHINDFNKRLTTLEKQIEKGNKTKKKGWFS